MNTALWIIQILLALVFLLAGLTKLTQPKDKLVERMHWVKDTDSSVVKAIGFVEILGAIGIVLPALTNILPVLTPLAAGGLVLTMIGASVTHYRLKEYPMIGGTILLGLLAVFVLYGRLLVVPL